MIKRITCTLTLAIMLSATHTAPVFADDKPFLAKLFSATAYGRDVIQYRTTDKKKIQAKKDAERRERQRNAPVGSLGIRG